MLSAAENHHLHNPLYNGHFWAVLRFFAKYQTPLTCVLAGVWVEVRGAVCQQQDVCASTWILGTPS